MPFLLKLLPEVFEIIYFAVTDKPYGFILVTHGLMACVGEINDA
jgi:hypothetical protein